MARWPYSSLWYLLLVLSGAKKFVKLGFKTVEQEIS